MTDFVDVVIICSIGGLVLDYTVVSYDEVAVFQPVINGNVGEKQYVPSSFVESCTWMGIR